MNRKIILRIVKIICIFYECLCKASVKLCVKCLEGSTPVAMLIVQVLWRSAFQAQTLHVYMNQFQDKTNPSLVTGLRCKPYTRKPFDYRWLCELVLG